MSPLASSFSPRLPRTPTGIHMFILRVILRGALFLGFFLLLTHGAVPAREEDGYEHVVAHGSDARQFMGELRSGGALQFYEDTEDIIRAGKFERAYLRLVFLRAHIQGLPLEVGLVPMVDQRLKFLREQMHLGEGVQYAARVERPARKKRPVKPACPPPPKVKEPPEEKPPEVIIPPAIPENKAAESPKAEATPPAGEARPPAAEAPKPPPTPSFWEKFKRKLKFW